MSDLRRVPVRGWDRGRYHAPMQRRVRPLLALIALLSFGAAGCIQFVPPPGAAPLRYRDAIFSTVNVVSDIPYGSAVDQMGVTKTLKLDLYTPAGDTATSRPLMVYVHGGGFSGGNKTSPELIDEANHLAKSGYVVVSISYRLAPQGCVGAPSVSCIVGIQHSQYDAQAAVRFMRANASTYGIDPNKIAMGGSSAGAITALNVAYSPDDVGTSGTPGVSSEIQAAVSLSGARLRGTPELGEAPALLLHGTADPLVPYAWAQDTLATVSAANVFATMTTWEGDGHVPYVQHRQEILDQTTNFLYWTLGLGG